MEVYVRRRSEIRLSRDSSGRSSHKDKRNEPLSGSAIDRLNNRLTSWHFLNRDHIFLAFPPFPVGTPTSTVFPLLRSTVPEITSVPGVLIDTSRETCFSTSNLLLLKHSCYVNTSMSKKDRTFNGASVKGKIVRSMSVVLRLYLRLIN